MTKKIKIGNVYAILLPDSTYAFGKIYKDGCVGFYKERALNKKNLPKYEDFQFIVGVYKDVIREWELVDFREFVSIEESWPPPMCVYDELNDSYSKYDKGEFFESNKEECEKLEVAAVWDRHHIIDRLMGDDSWVKL